VPFIALYLRPLRPLCINQSPCPPHIHPYTPKATFPQIFFFNFFLIFYFFIFILHVHFNYYRFWGILGDLRQFYLSFGMVNRFRIESV
jgi:hypothetical protein